MVIYYTNCPSKLVCSPSVMIRVKKDVVFFSVGTWQDPSDDCPAWLHVSDEGREWTAHCHCPQVYPL